MKAAPSTKVKTAHGIIDLRCPPQKDGTNTTKSFRQYNNRLTTMASDSSALPMDVNQSFPALLSENARSETISHPHIVTIARDRCEIIDLSSSSSSMEVDDERKRPALDNKEFAASEMYERIISRGRTELTNLVKNRNRTGDEESAKKKMKRTVKTLQKEKCSGEHIATILDVTSNGDDLTASPMINSQDCLALVMDLYED